MKLTIYSFMYLFFFASISLTGQVMNRQEIEKGTSIKRNALYNLEEIKVRWKKAALENCPGVPCVTSTVPGAPTNVVATTGNTTASVAFTAPTNNGGSVITGYTVRSNPGNIIATGSTSPITVTGLTNGTAYTFTVVATNAVGNSVASAPSTSVTPISPTLPDGPTNLIAIGGNGQVTLHWTAPVNTGGVPITDYIIGYQDCQSAGNFTPFQDGISNSTTAIVNGLVNGTTYTFAVLAVNSVGQSLDGPFRYEVPTNACSIPSVSDIDGNVYTTVQIGTQCWLKQNLYVTKFNDGTPIPLDTIGDATGASTVWRDLSTPARSYDFITPGFTFIPERDGYFYNAFVVNDSKNICPSGWRVPTVQDFTTLNSSFNDQFAGQNLKENCTDFWESGYVADNISGFSARGLGYRGSSGSFGNQKREAWFWTTDLSTNKDNRAADLFFRSTGFRGGAWGGTFWNARDYNYGKSIRCIKN